MNAATPATIGLPGLCIALHSSLHLAHISACALKSSRTGDYSSLRINRRTTAALLGMTNEARSVVRFNGAEPPTCVSSAYGKLDKLFPRLFPAASECHCGQTGAPGRAGDRHAFFRRCGTAES